MKVTTAILILCFVFGCQEDTRFDSEQWKIDNQVRERQSKGLVKSKILLDKSYVEITDLLGEPDLDFRLLSDRMTNENFEIQYVLGNCQMSIDFKRLQINFQDKKVKNTSIICD